MADAGKKFVERNPGFMRGLSGKVLWLTIIFVMIGEVLIFLPSIANYRITWLKSRIAQAEIAVLAVKAAPEQMLSDELRTELLTGAGVLVVSLKKGDTRQLVLRGTSDHMIDASFDLRATSWPMAIYDAFDALLAGDGRVINVTDIPPSNSGDLIDVSLAEAQLRKAMLQYGFNILILSIILSLLVASLVFAALNTVIVRPIKKLRVNMLAFGESPEDPSRIMRPTGRRDEIGVAEEELRDIQTELASLLQQKSRLAALGLAVSKVSHDLRNMLTSAHLISDRLAHVNDPTVKKFAPKLIASIDRAIDFCESTLKFGRAQEAPPRREKFALKPLVDDVIEGAAIQASSRVVLYNNVPPSVEADADREHIHRVLTNLIRNAVQALESGEPTADGAVTIKAWREGAVTALEVRDNGPGVPERVRGKLFAAFQSAARPGGTGLGLAIAAELVNAHGGSISLAETGEKGTAFRVDIPDRAIELRTGRRGERTAS
jgi:signal transduction histidine kinase